MKSFVIDKHLVVKAWKRVKANRGAAGVDNVTIAEFEKNLKDKVLSPVGCNQFKYFS